VRRQALELSPSRFEYDTSRLLKVLDMTLAEVRTVRDDAAVISTAAAPQAAQSTSENESLVAGTAPGLLAGEDSGIAQPAARHSHESTPAPSKPPPSDEGRPRKNASDLGRSRTLRRLVIIGIALAAFFAIYLIIQFYGRLAYDRKEQWRAIVRK
jgi:hypothetical protein